MRPNVISNLRGVAAITLMLIDTLFWAVPVHLFALIKLLVTDRTWQAKYSRLLMDTVNFWIWGILTALRLTGKTVYDIRGREQLSTSEWYFINCNHQSWADILVLLNTFHGHIPFFKFFLKRQLFKIPILGTAWWALDYPFMDRHSKEFIEKNPHLKGKDLETTRKACERYHHTPVSILNFVEGTRFSREKHAGQQSPYRHLLKPKAGGFAFTLAAMDGRIRKIIDVTIIYPRRDFTFWDFLCGRIAKVTVLVKTMPVPDEFIRGDYENDPIFRERFQAWVSGLWEDKDRTLDEYLGPSVS
jgi:1-acyl-sn-glycerol-3-phosphate acyltransferase